jgi:glyoxylase-like metal-dependent hydrolase (beta-lactamase superfamily II)
MIRIGDIEITPVNDGQVMVDSGGPFGLVPRALWARHYQADDQCRVPLHHNCLLVRAAGRTMVVDTGLGTRMPEKMARALSMTRPQGDLVEGLARLGVASEDVDLVINTHLHSDHCGGNTRFDAAGNVVPTFPNAEYWVQRLEYADAAFPNERTRGTYLADNFVPLVQSGQLRLIDGDLAVLPGMRLVLTPGHTRAHMSVVFEQGGQSALYVADMSTFAVHFANLAWMTAYDVEPLITLETKRTWQRWALARNALLLFEHDPLTVAGRLAQEGDRLRVVPAEADAPASTQAGQNP